MLVGRSRRSMTVAGWSVAILMVTHEIQVKGALGVVLLRSGGNDFLTYEGFARTILDTWSFQGGEDVFYYQPAFRYLRFGVID